MARCLEKCPVVVPRQLLDGFHQAETLVAPFGNGISIADHCLQVATDVHHADWVPDVYRRDMVIMALFHDVYYAESASAHGEIVARLLEGRIHPHVLAMLRHHTDLSGQRKASAAPADKFPVSTHKMLDHFNELDIHSIHRHHDWLPLEFFQREGYFRVDEWEVHVVTGRASWLSPNGTLVWAAPSLWIERTPVLLAKKLLLFEKAGLPPVELMVTDGGPELLRQVNEGKVHVAEIGLFPFLAAMDSPTPPAARLIGSTFIQQLDHYLAAGHPTITSMEQLRGRRVGVLSHGSCDSYLLRAMLSASGVDPSEVQEVPLGALYGSTDVLRDGAVDAAFLVEPALSHAEDQGIARVLRKASALYPRFQWGGLLGSDQICAEAPDVLLRALEVYRDACRLMHGVVTTGEPKQLLAALCELGPQWFQVSESTFLRALKRDAATWQLDWESVDFQGAEACANIQRELGVFQGRGPRTRDAFALELRQRAAGRAVDA